MGWATAHIEKLKLGETVSFRPPGNSMTPRIRHHDLCTVVPIGDRLVEKDDVVLCKVNGKEYLHLVLAIRHGGMLQIGNNHGHINGWVSPRQVFGLLVSVEP